jgi:hypothetical protein
MKHGMNHDASGRTRKKSRQSECESPHKLTAGKGRKQPEPRIDSVSECPECKEIMEEIGSALRRHLGAIARLLGTVAVEPDSAFDSLTRSVHSCRLAEMHALERYEDHIVTHFLSGRRKLSNGTC